MNSAEYLQKTVGKYLSKALCEVAIRRPERPIEFLAYNLIAQYERDLEIQKDEKGKDLKESESVRNIIVTPQMSQMFMRKLSTSMSKDFDDISPAAASPSISIGLEETSTEESKPLSDEEYLLKEIITRTDGKMPLGERDRKSSREKEEDLSKKEVESAVDDLIQKTTVSSITDLYDIPERRPSAIRDNEPITQEEIKEFGTTDPFLARRNTNLFDVNFAPIGDPSNQPNPPL